jgi:hypothetical protein
LAGIFFRINLLWLRHDSGQNQQHSWFCNVIQMKE